MTAKVSGERLEITDSEDEESTLNGVRWIPLFDIEHLYVNSSVKMSLQSLCKLIKNEIPVTLSTPGQQFYGTVIRNSRQVSCLASQIDAHRDMHARLEIATTVVNAKIRNMRRVLQRLCANRNYPSVARKWLGALARQANNAESLDTLRGIEGAATGRYFETLASFFPADCPFQHRSRRPPHNEANALISLLYTLLTCEMTTALRIAGLEPAWGVYHETEDGRPALALDLIEPFRAPLADALALDLLNHRSLQATDFAQTENGFRLHRSASRKLYTAWESRLQRSFQYEAEHKRTTLRTLIQEQAQQIKQYFTRRSAYKPFIMN